MVVGAGIQGRVLRWGMIEQHTRARLIRLPLMSCVDVYLDCGLIVRTRTISMPRLYGDAWMVLVIPVNGIAKETTKDGFWFVELESVRYEGGWRGHPNCRSI